MRPLLLALCLAAPAGLADECSDDDADAAEQSLGQVIDQLKAHPGGRGSWEKLLASIRRYRSCDEEEIAAIFSEAVCRQLSSGWKDAAQIGADVRKDGRLLSFLVEHLDESCGQADLEQVRRNAKGKCPRYGARLCAALVDRAESQLGDRAGRAAAPAPAPQGH
jgi:hypothetical protein